MEEAREKNNFYRKLSVLVIAWFVLFFSISDSQAGTASLYLTPSSGNYSTGGNLSVSVYINSTEQSVNACSGKITFPADKLEVTSISKSGSVIVFWAQEPSFSNNAGTISFEGVILTANGYTGSAGKVLTINFKVKAAGQANVAFIGGSLLANDGLGTNILTGMGSAKYILGAEAPAPIEIVPAPIKEEKEPTKPEPEIEVASDAPRISSVSHPDQTAWYNNDKAIFIWDLPRQADGVSIMLNDKSASNPGPNSDGLFAEKTYQDIEDGIHYFHLKIKKDGAWSSIGHYKIQIDTEPPEPFNITTSQDVNGHTLINFSTSDALSGLDKYRVKIDNEYYEVSATENILDILLPIGSHTIVVRALDKAGNEAVAVADLNVSSITILAINIMPEKLETTSKLFLGGTGKPDLAVELVVENKATGQTIVRKQLTTGQDGTWYFIYDHNLSKGNYVARIKQVSSDQFEDSKEFIVASPLRSHLSNAWVLGLVILIFTLNIIFVVLAVWLYIKRSHLMGRPAKEKVKHLLEDDLLNYQILIDQQMARLGRIKDQRNNRLAQTKVKHELKTELKKMENKIVKKIHKY
ncbi:MAG: cohesin domain-containing protein [bacterium]